MIEPSGCEELVYLDVLLPVRAPAPWLSETLIGLRNQTRKDWTLLGVIHESSLSTAVEILEFFPGAQIIEVSDEFTLPQSLSAGIESSTAEYIARIDSDDVPLPTRFEIQSAYLDEAPEVALVTSPIELIDENGHSLGFSHRHPTGDLRKNLLRKNVIAHPAVMFRREAIMAVGGYSLDALHGEDYELWLRLAAGQQELHTLEEPLTQYRLHDKQITATRAMNSSGRQAIRSARRRLGQELGVSQVSVAALNLLWTVRQQGRALMRSDG